MTEHVVIKPTRHIMNLCREMFERRAKYGADYPKDWRAASRKKLEAAGYVRQTSEDPKYGPMFYFTDAGLKWYLQHADKR